MFSQPWGGSSRGRDRQRHREQGLWLRVLGEKGEERERGRDCRKQRESDPGQSEKDERHHAEAVGRQRDPYAAGMGREKEGEKEMGTEIRAGCKR